MGDELRALVPDNGSDVCKAGFVGDVYNEPSYAFTAMEDFKDGWLPLLQRTVTCFRNVGSNVYDLRAISQVSRAQELTPRSTCQTMPFFAPGISPPKFLRLEDGTKLERIRCSVTYPEAFCPTIGTHFRNPSQLQSEQSILEWLDQYKLLLKPSVRQAMQRLESNSFGNFVLPMATPLYASLMGKYFALFVLVDDQIVEPMNGDTCDLDIFATATQLAGKMTYEEVAVQYASVCNKPVNSSGTLLGQYVAAWMNLIGEFVRLGASDTWKARLSAAVSDYIAYGLRESKSVSQLQHQWSESCQSSRSSTEMINLSIYHDPADPSDPLDASQLHSEGMSTCPRIVGDKLLAYIFRQRIPNIGVPMFAILLERACGVELQACVSADAVTRVKLLVDLCSVPCFLVNDMYGLARDIQRNEHCFNDMLLTGSLCQWTLQQSIQFANALHDACVEGIGESTAKMQQEFPLLQTYFHWLRLLVRGYGQWHAHCTRYTQSTAICLHKKQAFVFSLNDAIVAPLSPSTQSGLADSSPP